MNYSSKPSAWECPNVEDIKFKEDMAFTIAPNDQHQYFKENSLHRIQMFHTIVSEKIFQQLSPFADYRLFLEISKNGRLHYHGYIRILNYGFFIKAVYELQQWCTYCIKKLAEKDEVNNRFSTSGWVKYINKQNMFRDTIDPEYRTISNEIRLKQKEATIISDFMKPKKKKESEKKPVKLADGNWSPPTSAQQIDPLDC